MIIFKLEAAARLVDPATSAMNVRTRRRNLLVRLGLTLILILISANCVLGSIPPAFVAQQQDLAVRVDCSHWRKTHRDQALEGDDVKRVVTDLEKLYPTAFPECRSDGERLCSSWLDALVRGLRRYGRRSLRAVCANQGSE